MNSCVILSKRDTPHVDKRTFASLKELSFINIPLLTIRDNIKWV